MADTSPDTMMEEREEAMVSPLGGNPFLKTAHFLKPISKTNPHHPSPLSKTTLNFDVGDITLQVSFRTATCRKEGWKNWVHKLLPKYQNTWKKSGIYDAILSSTCKIIRQKELILALAERWCVATNTFVFPWGETTITLEDMVVLGGYSVLGESVFSPLTSNGEVVKIEEELMKAFRNTGLHVGRRSSQLLWMNHFMGKDSVIEHEAFLAFWLSKYALCTGCGCISRSAFPIAIHLSRGTRLAIAPAVLAILYRDLSMLKRSTISSSKGQSRNSGGYKDSVNLWGPLHLVQAWAWERFLTVRPNPNPIRVGDPRLARWQKLKGPKVVNVRKVIDSAGEYFQWRPYCMVVNNWRFNEVYRANEEWVVVGSGMGEDIETFAMCIRPSELIGLAGCIEQYLPHRVAMQFGMDQDIPGFVPRFNNSPELAWSNYKRPIGDKKLYIAARLFEADVTVRYLAWWDPEMVAKEDTINSDMAKHQSKTGKRLPQSSQQLREDHEERVSLDEDNLTIGELLRSKHKAKVFEEGLRIDNISENSSLFILKNGASKGAEMAMDPFAVDGNADKPNAHSTIINNIENEISMCDELDTAGSELEPRISRLERLVAMLKAENIGLEV